MSTSLTELNGRFGEIALHRRAWFRNLVVTRRQLSLHRHYAAMSAKLRADVERE